MILIDGSWLLHRSIRTPGCIQFKASDGTITGGLHFFLNSLRKLHRITKGRQGFVICWDLGFSRYRRALFPGYKASRSSIDLPKDFKYSPEEEEFREVYLYTRSELHKIYLPLLECISLQVAHVEADDIIAWFHKHIDHGDITIVSRDQDFLQLIDERTKVWDPSGEGMLKDRDYVINEWNLEPELYREQLLLCRAMMGDSSDEIPGIKGIGWKTAVKISKTVLTEGEGALRQSLNTTKLYLEGKDLIERNRDLMDLRRVPDELTEEVLSAVKSSLLFGDQRSSDELDERLWAHELNVVRGFAHSIVEANLSSGLKNDVASILGLKLS